jgi:hypothetical protein
MATKRKDIRRTLSPDAEERVRRSVNYASDVVFEVETQENEAKISGLQMAIAAGLDSGISELGVFSRIRERHGLPQRDK